LLSLCRNFSFEPIREQIYIHRERDYFSYFLQAMSPQDEMNVIHYHIQWSSHASLDWKPFPTREEAIKLAEKLKFRDETYTIVTRDGDCERCNAVELNAA
jgi:hypothetical protein